jgi:hypothetical protein
MTVHLIVSVIRHTLFIQSTGWKKGQRGVWENYDWSWTCRTRGLGRLLPSGSAVWQWTLLWLVRDAYFPNISLHNLKDWMVFALRFSQTNAAFGSGAVRYGTIQRYSYTVLTPWSRVFLEKYAQLVKKFPAFYGTRRFITVFTRAHHLSLSWAKWI